MQVVGNWLMQYGHLPIILAIIFRFRIHVRIVRNGSGRPKIEWDIWIAGNKVGTNGDH